MKQTENALVTLLETGNKVVAAIKNDGKVDFGEGVAITLKAAGLVRVIKNLGEIKEEIKVATPEQLKALVTLFEEKFDLPNDEAEAKIETGLKALVELAMMIFGKES